MRVNRHDVTLIPKLIIFPTSKQTNKQMKNTMHQYLFFSLELIAFLISKVLIKLANYRQIIFVTINRILPTKILPPFPTP